MSKVHRLVERRTVNNVIFNGKWGIITKIFRNFIMLLILNLLKLLVEKKQVKLVDQKVVNW
jgi:hypothetical protein